jgi:hypothetical protein
VAQVRANVARQAEDAAQDSPELAEALIESYQSADPMAQGDPSFVAVRGWSNARRVSDPWFQPSMPET